MGAPHRIEMLRTLHEIMLKHLHPRDFELGSTRKMRPSSMERVFFFF